MSETKKEKRYDVREYSMNYAIFFLDDIVSRELIFRSKEKAELVASIMENDFNSVYNKETEKWEDK